MKKIIPWSQAHFVSNEKFHLNKLLTQPVYREYVQLRKNFANILNQILLYQLIMEHQQFT